MNKPHIVRRKNAWRCEGAFGPTPKDAYDAHLAIEDMSNRIWGKFNEKFNSESDALFCTPIDNDDNLTQDVQ